MTKPTKIIYDLSNLSLTINHSKEEVEISVAGQAAREPLVLAKEEAIEMAVAILDNLRPMYFLSTESPIHVHVPHKQVEEGQVVNVTPTSPPPVEKNNSIAATNALSGLFVLQKGVHFLRRDVPFGQEIECDGPIEMAKFFQDPTEVAALAQRLGAQVIPAEDVMPYRVVVQLPDGGLRFWVGNHLPLSDHVNNSTRIVGIKQANDLLSIVLVADGQKKFLMPVTTS
jgi:hypothetical protein